MSLFGCGEEGGVGKKGVWGRRGYGVWRGYGEWRGYEDGGGMGEEARVWGKKGCVEEGGMGDEGSLELAEISRHYKLQYDRHLKLCKHMWRIKVEWLIDGVWRGYWDEVGMRDEGVMGEERYGGRRGCVEEGGMGDEGSLELAEISRHYKLQYDRHLKLCKHMWRIKIEWLIDGVWRGYWDEVGMRDEGGMGEERYGGRRGCGGRRGYGDEGSMGYEGDMGYEGVMGHGMGGGGGYCRYVTRFCVLMCLPKCPVDAAFES